jgi:hypothetical protein
VLDHFVVDVPGAEQADEAGVRGRDQDGPLSRAAGAPDVVPQDVGVDYDGWRPQQDVSRERALGAGEADGRDRAGFVHVSDRAADELRDVLQCAEAVLHTLQVTESSDPCN